MTPDLLSLESERQSIKKNKGLSRRIMVSLAGNKTIKMDNFRDARRFNRRYRVRIVDKSIHTHGLAGLSSGG